MALYEITDTGLDVREPAAFAPLGLRERQDLQRLLRDRIDVLDQDLLVIAEEFGEWEDAKRRVDLLAVDHDGHLVVIELKRTDDGGHMELQALRYAAMVSAMGFEQAVDTYARHLTTNQGPQEDTDPRRVLLEWMGAYDGADDVPVISSKVRILLVSREFGREITTTVLWLNDQYGLDIRCIRLTPYELDGRVLLDVRQVIPLPEAADYRVRLRRKEQQQEQALRDGRDFTRYCIIVDGVARPSTNKRRSVLGMVGALVAQNVAIKDIASLMTARQVAVVEGELTDPTEIKAALRRDGRDAERFFSEEPFCADGQTYVVWKMWGRGTDLMLERLSSAFPTAGVDFREADE